MVLVTQDPSGIHEGIGAFAQALGQTLNERRQQSGLSAFNDALSKSNNDPASLMNAYQQALNAGADPQQLQLMQGAYQQSRQQNAFQTAYDAALNKGGLDSEDGQNEFIMAYSKGGGDPFKAIEMFKKNPRGQTVFEKKIDEFKANAVIDHLQGGNERANMMNDNLNFLESNIENVGTVKGLTSGEFITNSELFTEYRNRGNLVLDGVIKVFNKAGVLPEKKLKWLRDTFAISPWDTQEQIKGKINALKSLAQDASSYNQEMGNLIEKYGEKIPTREFLKLQKSLDSSLDNLYSPTNSSKKEGGTDTGEVFDGPKASNAAKYKGKIATDSETGQKLISNGTRWVVYRG